MTEVEQMGLRMCAWMLFVVILFDALVKIQIVLTERVRLAEQPYVLWELSKEN